MTTIEPIARAGAAITSVLGSGTENDPMYEPSLMSNEAPPQTDEMETQ
jgi:hypothetical protein